ncbi:MAG: flavin-containing monooxygenase [Trueperaceae bacterium]
MITKQINTVIVGAGPAGLAVAACLRQKEQDFVLLEQNEKLAHVWHTFYDAMHIHTDRSGTNLPHLNMSRDYPKYPSRDQMLKYFHNYASHFEIKPEFNQTVKSISYEDSYRVITQTQEVIARNLVLCTGRNGKPIMPGWAGQFSGNILHSSHYTTSVRFAKKNVLVVGFGNSAHDIIADLYRRGASVTVSVRNGVNIVSRDVFGIPIARIAELAKLFPTAWSDVLTRGMFRLLHGNLESYGLLQPQRGVFTQIEGGQIPVLDSGTLELIKKGYVRVVPGIESVDKYSFKFINGREQNFDCCILATGYEINAPAKSFNLEDNETLFLCGFNSVATGLIREMGLEAQNIANKISTQGEGQR